MRAAGGAISVLIGAVLFRLVVTGSYQRYVRTGMAPWLLLAAVAVVVIGIATLHRASLGKELGDAHDHTHDQEDLDHQHGIGVGWLLLAPIAVLLLVAPPPLGSYGVDRASTIDVRAGGAVFDPIPPSSEPVAMTLLEFGQRAFDHDGASFNGTSVQLTGFVAGTVEGGFRLARYQIACCAADAAPVVVLVAGTAGDAPARDQWISVTGTFGGTDGDFPELRVTSVIDIPAPEDPYE
jgi:uncharacterized repeat protein (TIGR03943 family)